MEDVDDLVVWLRAQLDEDERMATEATPGPWRYNPNKAWHLPADLHARTNGEEFVGAGPLDATIGVAATGPADHPQSMADARFIARHDPARVLREVEAKRRIVDALPSWAPGGLPADPMDDEPEYAYGRARALYEAIQWLALAYADRPGYREEW